MKFIKKLLCKLFGWFCPTPPEPPVPPDPPTKWVKVWICEDNLNFLSRTDCRKGILVGFIKGTEPTEMCTIDHTPEPPIPPLPPKYDEYHINWIGLLSWMYLNPTQDIDFLMKRSREMGCSCIHSFSWVGDPSPDNSYTMEATPWLWRDGKIDFDTENTDFWFQFRRLTQACKDNDMDFMPILFMARYNYKVFDGLNHNGVYDFYSPEAMVYQKQYARMCIATLIDIYGSGYEPTVLLQNEPAHYGDDDAGHQIAEWHRDLGDYVLRYTSAKRMWIDSSHSEYAKAYFVERHQCPKCDFIFGRDEYANRPVRCESHGCSTKEGFIENGYEHWTQSGWLHGVFNEDGSGYGSKLCDGISAFRQADMDELIEALTWAESIKGHRQMYFVAFPFDPIRNAREDYSNPGMFDWNRLRVYGEIRA